MANGLLYVLSEPGNVDEAEFHDWYDNEHAPARTALEEVVAGHRYRAADGQRPTWMALYELPLELLARPEYLRLREERSDREARIVENLACLDRMVYEMTETSDPKAVLDPAPCLIAVSIDPGEYGDERLDAWYREEHLALLRKVPGWRSSRRFRLVEGPGLPHLALHDWESEEAFSTDEFRAATSTPWRDEVFAGIAKHDRRVFRHHRTA